MNQVLSFYDDTVDYFDYGRKNKNFIANDYRKYFEISPVRSYSIGDVRVENSQNSATVTFDLRYTVQNVARNKYKTGRAHDELILTRPNGSLKIVGIKETVYPDNAGSPTPSAATGASPGNEQSVRDFITQYYNALAQRNLDTTTSSFANAAYYDGRMRSRQYIRHDIAEYLRKYSVLAFEVQEPINVSADGSGRYTVSFTLRYNVSGSRGVRHGTSSNQWVIQSDNSGLRITSQKETVFRER